MEVGFEATDDRVAFSGGELDVEEFLGCDEVGEEGSVLGCGDGGQDGEGDGKEGSCTEGQGRERYFDAHGDFSVLVVQISEKSYLAILIKSKVPCNILIFLPSSS